VIGGADVVIGVAGSNFNWGEGLLHEGVGVMVGLSSCKDFGGHSLFSLTSSLAESPVICDVTLVLRGMNNGVLEDGGLLFFCCSKRPMRLATLARGRSSGSGL
jgi:hypothetical protein